MARQRQLPIAGPSSSVPRTRSALRLLLVAGSVLLAACSRCGKPTVEVGASGLLERVPRDARAVLVVPDLRPLGAKLKRLEQLKAASFAAQLSGFSSADEYLTAVFNGVGLDLRREEALREAGLAPGRGAALISLSDGESYAVVGVHDGERLLAAVGALAKNRLGASVRSTRAEDGQTVTTFERPGAGGPPEVGIAIAGRYAVVGRHVAPASLRAALALAHPASLAADPILTGALARLPPERDLFVYVPKLQPAGAIVAGPGVTLTASLDETGLSLHADVPALAGQAAWVAQAHGESLLYALPPDAFLVAQFLGDPSALAPLWKAWSPMAPVLDRAGLDVEKEVLGNMSPGAVVSLALAPTAALGGGLPDLDVRQTNPFRYVQLVSVGRAKDAGRVDESLKRLIATGPKLGLSIERVSAQGQQVFRTSYSRGESASVARMGNQVVVAAPFARVSATLERLAHPGAAAPAVALLDNAAPLSVAVDLKVLSDEIRALPEQAWGVGGFAIKATVVRWLDALDDFKAIDFSLTGRPEALELSAHLRVARP